MNLLELIERAEHKVTTLAKLTTMTRQLTTYLEMRTTGKVKDLLRDPSSGIIQVKHDLKLKNKVFGFKTSMHGPTFTDHVTPEVLKKFRAEEVFASWTYDYVLTLRPQLKDRLAFLTKDLGILKRDLEKSFYARDSQTIHLYIAATVKRNTKSMLFRLHSDPTKLDLKKLDEQGIKLEFDIWYGTDAQSMYATWKNLT